MSSTYLIPSSSSVIGLNVGEICVILDLFTLTCLIEVDEHYDRLVVQARHFELLSVHQLIYSKTSCTLTFVFKFEKATTLMFQAPLS